MSPNTHTPQVTPEREFLEIANDFTDSKEIFREAISNAFDAGGQTIHVSVFIDRSEGEDQLVVRIEDDGHGMNVKQLEAFFNLGDSTRSERDELGNKVKNSIGEKGHGTKIFWNSKHINVMTRQNGKAIEADLDNPIQTLRKGELPPVLWSETATDAHDGTIITVRGYNGNVQQGFGHAELKDYIYWFTKYGSFERELDMDDHKAVRLILSGLGNEKPEPLDFGHRFPTENTNLTTLKRSDKVSPLDYYVARWTFREVTVVGMPNSKIDIVFYIEGDQAKRAYNPMLHKKYADWKSGEYNVEGRYGLWVAKDYIPVARKNEWVASRSEWTKYHAFVNSQDFRLTANRSSIDNTSPMILECIEKTVRQVFNERIANDPKYVKYKDELLKEEQYANAKQEEKDFERRKKAAFSQKVAGLDGHTLIEPRQESGVYSLVLQLLVIREDLFDFDVIDYDTKFGYDLLVTRDTALDLNRAELKFVEMKHMLKRDFSHSFARLAAVICWDTKLANGDEVHDLKGERRKMVISASTEDSDHDYTKFMLVSDTQSHNIEVIVLKQFLKEKLKLEFTARTTST